MHSSYLPCSEDLTRFPGVSALCLKLDSPGACAQILQAANAWRDQPEPKQEAQQQQELADWAEKHYLRLLQQRQAAAAAAGAGSGSPPCPPGRRRGAPGQRASAGAPRSLRQHGPNLLHLACRAMPP